MSGKVQTGSMSATNLLREQPKRQTDVSEMFVGGQYIGDSRFIHDDDAGQVGERNLRLVSQLQPQLESRLEAFRSYLLNRDEWRGKQSLRESLGLVEGPPRK
jgi:hypothetical protein